MFVIETLFSYPDPVIHLSDHGQCEDTCADKKTDQVLWPT